MKLALTLAASALTLALASPASAANLVVFGNNAIGSLYVGGGNTVTVASDAQIATAGFLSSFDAFVYTRDGSDFGTGLSAAAAANVMSFVTGNFVLFNGDFADGIGSANENALFNNALSFVLGGSGKGYIGEFNGAVAALAGNGNGFTPLGLTAGTAGALASGAGGADTTISLTASGVGSPIVSGVTFPYNPSSVEFGAQITGENASQVVARYATGNAAIIAGSLAPTAAAVPEPATWAMMLIGFGFVGGAMRSAKRRQAQVRFAF
jgi:hypothetical protein